jgi:hypothetical protein
MLICDWCVSGWHLWCLRPALTRVPAGIWICPDCKVSGITPQNVADKKEKFIFRPLRRPNIELPSPRRRAKARKLVEQWHGAVVTKMFDEELMYGRVVFTDIHDNFWFKVYWEDGTNEEADMRLLRHCTIVDEMSAPGSLQRKPEPVQIFLGSVADKYFPDMRRENIMMRELANRQDVLDRLEYTIGGKFTDKYADSLVPHLPCYDLPPYRGRAEVPDFAALFHALRMDQIGTILDPWGGNKTIATALNSIPRPRPNLILNVYGDLAGWGPIMHELPRENWKQTAEHPLTSDCVRLFPPVSECPSAIICCPPAELIELCLPLLVEAEPEIVCMLVPKVLLSSVNLGLFTYLHSLQQADRLFKVDPVVPFNSEPPYRSLHTWVCVTPEPWSISRVVRTPHLLDFESQKVYDDGLVDVPTHGIWKTYWQ